MVGSSFQIHRTGGGRIPRVARQRRTFPVTTEKGLFTYQLRRGRAWVSQPIPMHEEARRKTEALLHKMGRVVGKHYRFVATRRVRKA